MAKVYEELDERLQDFIRKQKMFFVASAPLSGDGLVNVSPKGLNESCILDEKTVAYLDLLGSGVESVAHIKENGRFVIMFCWFDSTPKILRLHGRGQVIEQSDPEWNDLASHFEITKAARAIIKLSIERVADSCGWGVPMYDFKGHRAQYDDYMAQTDDDGLRQLQENHCLKSLDGLPALDRPTV